MTLMWRRPNNLTDLVGREGEVLSQVLTEVPPHTPVNVVALVADDGFRESRWNTMVVVAV
jgi:hypothetical protein